MVVVFAMRDEQMLIFLANSLLAFLSLRIIVIIVVGAIRRGTNMKMTIRSMLSRAPTMPIANSNSIERHPLEVLRI